MTVIQLIRYDAARRALAEAARVDEAMAIHNKAVGVRAYAMQAKDRQLIEHATEIQLRAQRRVGELLAEMKARGERRRGEQGQGLQAVTLPKLSDLGVSKIQSSRWQKLAEMNIEDFEGMVKDAKKSAVNSLGRTSNQKIRSVGRKEYQAETSEGCTVDDLNLLVSSGERFSVIYADPPWSFKVYSGKGKQRSADRHYDTQSLDDIKALPVNNLASDDCALFLWCVMPELPGALEVVRAWGFEYKTVAFVWVKTNENDKFIDLAGKGLHWGMGYWTRANAEICLLATRGAPKRQDMGVHQVVIAPVSEHSRKPDEVQCRIERLLPGPYLELYARRAVPGWTVWGNQINRSLFHQDIPELVA